MIILDGFVIIKKWVLIVTYWLDESLGVNLFFEIHTQDKTAATKIKNSEIPIVRPRISGL